MPVSFSTASTRVSGTTFQSDTAWPRIPSLRPKAFGPPAAFLARLQARMAGSSGEKCFPGLMPEMNTQTLIGARAGEKNLIESRTMQAHNYRLGITAWEHTTWQDRRLAPGARLLSKNQEND